MNNTRLQLTITTLRHAREKLEIYRDHSDGQYHGGLEHTAMIARIDRTLPLLEDSLNLKVWTHNRFKGFWPVGTAAVVVAETREEAGYILNEQLDRMGLPFCDPDQFEEVPLENGVVRVLRDGEY